MVSCAFAQAEEAAKDATTTPAPAAEQAKEATTETKMTPEITKTIGYVFGYQTGAQMTQGGPIKIEDIDAESFIKGMTAGLKNDQPGIDEASIAAAFDVYKSVMEKRTQEALAKNIEESKKYIEEKAKEEGVVKTASGLLYKVIEKGGDKKYEAPKDGAQDMGTKFKIKYKGTLPNGDVFDQTGDEPIEMPLMVIPGFKEALETMPVGAKWIIHLPADLAYGERAPGGKIGPNQALTFELELLDILPPDPNAPQAGGMNSISPEQLRELLEGAQAAEAPSAPVEGEGK